MGAATSTADMGVPAPMESASVAVPQPAYLPGHCLEVPQLRWWVGLGGHGDDCLLNG